MNFSIKILSVIFTFFSIALSSLAIENSLVGIDVKQTQTGSYNIQLKLEKSAQVKKQNTGKDNMTLVLNSTLPSESLEIVYDNSSDLDNVIVQKKNDNNTLILIQGKNIENSTIYTKELTTGKIKEIDNNNIIDNILFVADKKILAFSLVGFLLLYSLLLHRRPNTKRYSATSSYNAVNTKKQTNTLRGKNLNQTRQIPSINYNVNARFNNINKNASMPKDFVINKYNQIEAEKIRKAG